MKDRQKTVHAPGFERERYASGEQVTEEMGAHKLAELFRRLKSQKLTNEKINAEIMRIVKEQSPGLAQRVASFIPGIGPLKSLREHLKESGFSGEALEELAKLVRKELDETQEVVAEVAEVLEDEEEKLAIFKEEAEKAKKEWSLEQIEDFVFSRLEEANIPILESTRALIGGAHGTQNEEELRVERELLLRRLEIEVAGREKNIQLVREAAKSAAQAILQTGMQYLYFEGMRVPLQIAGEAARELTNMHLSALYTEGAIRATADVIGGSLVIVMDGVKLLADPAVKGDTVKRMQENVMLLEKKHSELKQLVAPYDTENRKRLSSGHARKKKDEEAEGEVAP